MDYKPQDHEMNNSGGIAGAVFSLISICSWLLTISIQNIQVAISITGGLIAMISGVISIYKNIKKP